MALAAATLFESRAAGWQVGVVIVDHQLQPGSGQVAAAVSRRLSSLGMDPVEVIAVQVGRHGGPEASARAARYDALVTRAALDGSLVLLGHTRDDQAETVLLGLVRGSGVRSLSGMPAVREPFRRPLLGVSRAQTTQACEAIGVEVWRDPHNDDERYARVRVRHQVLPMLERLLGPGVTEALARTASLARDDADALDGLAAELRHRAAAPRGGLEVAALGSSPAALRRRVLRGWAIAAGAPAGDLSATHVDGLDRLVVGWHGQSGVDLPGRLVARREAGVLRVCGRTSPG